MTVNARTQTSNAFPSLEADPSSSEDSYPGGPISVDEFLEMGGPSNPISIDAFLESELELRASYPHKDRVLSVSTATASTACVSPPVSPVPTAYSPSVAGSDSSEAPYESDPIEFGACEDDGKDASDQKSEIAVSKHAVPTTATSSSLVSSDSSGAPYERDSVEFSTFVDNVEDKDDQTSEIAGVTYDDSDSVSAASAETEVGSNRSSYTSSIVVKGRAVELDVGEEEVEVQEMTYEDDDSNKEQHRKDREQRRLERYKAAERKRVAKVMYFAVLLLMLEISAASIAVKNHQDLVECCGNSIFSEDESVGERWNKVFYWIGILYLPVIIVIEIPTMIIAQEPLFIFNPMVGYLLAMQMLYATDVTNAFIIFGLESMATLGQSRVLAHMRRSPESCLHTTLNYTMAAITAYMLIKLNRQGGYCIVGNRIQSVFTDQTCNLSCIDEETCFRCSSGDENFLPNCFIQFD